MSYATYNNQTFGTIAGVRGKLLSPEVALQVAIDDDTRYAITVNPTTDIFTTVVAHGYTAGQQVAFETTNTLPAPLVTGTGYYVLNPGSLTFQISTIVGGPALDITTAGTGTHDVYASAIDLLIQSVLNDTKNRTLRNHLDLWLRDVMPDTIEKWVQLRTNHFHRFHDRMNIDTLPLYGMFRGHRDAWYELGISIGSSLSGIQGRTKPMTFYVTTPPDSATLLGDALNGDRLIDAVARKLYINRGVDATPTVLWQRQNSEDCKDYIMNPDVLVQPHEYLTIARMFELGIFNNRGLMAEETRRDFMYKGQEYWHNKFVSTLYGERDERGRTLIPGMLKLLQTDFSNAGDYGDFSREMAGAEHWGIL